MHSLSFITLSKDPAVAKEIREALSATSRVRVLAESQDAETLLGDTLRLRPSAVIIVLEADASEKMFSVIKKLSAAVPETAIITAASNASPALILGSMRAGARQFLQLPIIADEHAFQHQRHRVEIYGVCRECRGRDLASLNA